MRSTTYQPIVSEAAAIVEASEKIHGKLAADADSRQLKLIRAATRLVTMFERAMTRANANRPWAGWPTAIRVRQEQDSHCYYCPGQHGVERTLWLSIALPLRDGHLFGGAYIKSGVAQKAMYVMTAVDTVPARWIVQASGSALTDAVVDDLFDTVFADDEDAAARLTPHYGFDLFATPWS